MGSRRAAAGGIAGLVAALAWATVPACAETGDHRFNATATGAGGAGAASGQGGIPLLTGVGGSGPPAPDAGGLCGNSVHHFVDDTPNVYFILDTSGSMADVIGGKTKMVQVHAAAVDVVARLGPLINVGAARFPLEVTAADSCHIGGQVLEVRRGQVGLTSQATVAFSHATFAPPNGGTPTAATLRALLPGLRGLPGHTIAILATDGGPNCDDRASCTKDGCTINLDGVCAMFNCCGENCCDPHLANDAALDCVDIAETVAAIAAFAEAGIQLYVIGIPGSEAYATFLDQMALAGGAPQFVSPYYYRVDDLGTIDSVFGSIASVVVSCDFTLTDPPKGRGMTNVYVDGAVLPYDPQNGWDWKSSSVVELVGQACYDLKHGVVSTVQIVSGCPTMGTK